MTAITTRILVLALGLAISAPPALAQQRRYRGAGSSSQIEKELDKSRKELAKATQEYKVSLESLLVNLEAAEKSALAQVDKRRELYGLKLISRVEVENSEREYADAKAKVEDTKRKIEEADDVYAEATAPIPPAYSSPGRGYVTSSAVIRGYGSAWSIADVGKVQSFFAGHFGRALPISAFGQSAVHDRLGFDHHNAVDVGVHPDSPEGQALMAYLRSAGIPFLAFRQEIPGKATGAHIHIGFPSHRLYH